MTATELCQRLEELHQDTTTGDAHAPEVTAALAETLRQARKADEQARCQHGVYFVRREFTPRGLLSRTFCGVCGKTLDEKEET